MKNKIQGNPSIFPSSIIVFGISVAVLVLHTTHYFPFIADDSLISLRYADRFLNGHGLTWTDGEAVEGYSNLLWVLACSFLGFLGFDLILSTRILGIAGMSSAILAVIYYCRFRDPNWIPGLASGLGLALTGSFAVWAIGGLEQPLLVGLLSWAFVLSVDLFDREKPLGFRDTFLPGLLFGLACLTRPDSPIFVFVVAGLILAFGGFRKSAWKIAGFLILFPIVFLLGQFVFRLAYYNDFIPNTARAKLAFSWTRTTLGLTYLRDGLLPLAGLVIPAVVSIFLSFRETERRRRIALFAIPGLVWCVYVMFIGGDIFPGRRHLVVLVFFLAALGVEFWAIFKNRLFGFSIMAIALFALGWGQLRWDRENQRAITERWEWDGQVIGELLSTAFADHQPLVAVTAAGCIPYFSQLPSLDMLGLNDSFLAKHPPENLGEGYFGHELGNGKYILGKKPDLVIFCSPAGRAKPCFKSGREMVEDPEIEKQYQLVPFQGRTPHLATSRIWVRKFSPRIGIVQSPHLAEIPGFLFLANRKTGAILDSQGRIGLYIPEAESAYLPRLSLQSGHWEFSLEASGDPEVTIRGSGIGDLFCEGKNPKRFFLDEASNLSVHIQGTNGSHIRKVTFRFIEEDG